jgi:cell division septum initiation protein DivIVA
MNSNTDNIFVGDNDHASLPEPLDYRLRCATKRTDLPEDVIRLLADAYHEVCLGQERVQVLRDKYDSLLDTNVELEARIKSLKEGFEGGCHICETVGDTNKRLREERDEARRDVCDMMHITGFLAGDYAASRGWDCFPDRKRNVSDEVKNFRTIIERDYNAVVAQRDEARREAMLLLSERSSEKEMREEYRKRGWSYLLSKEKTND